MPVTGQHRHPNGLPANFEIWGTQVPGCDGYFGGAKIDKITQAYQGLQV
jgi:hypothetical protein